LQELFELYFFSKLRNYYNEIEGRTPNKSKVDELLTLWQLNSCIFIDRRGFTVLRPFRATRVLGYVPGDSGHEQPISLTVFRFRVNFTIIEGNRKKERNADVYQRQMAIRSEWGNVRCI
jgi:hypothetical protein